jgi:hypothetical protein
MCKQCGKPNWAGCGAHVEQVLGDVPKSQRCSCRETGRPATKPASKSNATAGAKAGAAPAEPVGSMAKFKAWLKQ